MCYLKENFSSVLPIPIIDLQGDVSLTKRTVHPALKAFKEKKQRCLRDDSR